MQWEKGKKQQHEKINQIAYTRNNYTIKFFKQYDVVVSEEKKLN